MSFFSGSCPSFLGHVLLHHLLHPGANQSTSFDLVIKTSGLSHWHDKGATNKEGQDSHDSEKNSDVELSERFLLLGSELSERFLLLVTDRKRQR